MSEHPNEDTIPIIFTSDDLKRHLCMYLDIIRPGLFNNFFLWTHVQVYYTRFKYNNNTYILYLKYIPLHAKNTTDQLPFCVDAIVAALYMELTLTLENIINQTEILITFSTFPSIHWRRLFVEDKSNIASFSYLRESNAFLIFDRIYTFLTKLSELIWNVLTLSLIIDHNLNYFILTPDRLLIYSNPIMAESDIILVDIHGLHSDGGNFLLFNLYGYIYGHFNEKNIVNLVLQALDLRIALKLSQISPLTKSMKPELFAFNELTNQFITDTNLYCVTAITLPKMIASQNPNPWIVY